MARPAAEAIEASITNRLEVEAVAIQRIRRPSTASRYSCSERRATSPKSSGQSPKAPWASGFALLTWVTPSASRVNQWNRTRSGSRSPFAMRV